jgi:hypothetical protein
MGTLLLAPTKRHAGVILRDVPERVRERDR